MSFIKDSKVYLKQVSADDTEINFHPFQSGLIYRLEGNTVWIACSDGPRIGRIRCENAGRYRIRKAGYAGVDHRFVRRRSAGRDPFDDDKLIIKSIRRCRPTQCRRQRNESRVIRGRRYKADAPQVRIDRLVVAAVEVE